MKFPLGKLLRKVKQFIISPSLASDLFSLRCAVARVSCRVQGGRIRYDMPDIMYTSAHIIFLDDDLVVEFTDDDADEIY